MRGLSGSLAGAAPRHPQSLRCQHGITLLESMVAMVVLCAGVLGMLAVQMRTLVDTQTSARRSQAVRLIEDLAERIKTNPGGFRQLPDYVSDWSDEPAAPDCIAAACSAAGLALWDLSQWKEAIKQTLPAGRAKVFESADEKTVGLKRQLGVMVAWRSNERNAPADANYLKPVLVDAATSGGVTCPAGFNCHLVYVQP